MKTKLTLFIALLTLFFIEDGMAQAPAFEWVKQIGGTNYDRGLWITLDNVGNIYTMGNFKGTADFDPGTGVFNLTAANDSDIFISKLDPSGNFIWAKRIGGIGEEGSHVIALDASANIYISGWFQGISDFDPGPSTVNLTSTGGYDAFVTKLDSAGNLIWVKQIGGPSIQMAWSINADQNGNTFTVGTFYGTVDFDPGPGIFNLTSSTTDNIFICKLDASGNFLWAKAFSGSFQVPYATAIDNDYNIYITGVFSGTVDFDPGVGIHNMISNGVRDVFISKVDSSGNFMWAKQLGGASEDFGLCIAVDSDKNVYTSGLFGGNVDFDPGPGIYNLASLGINAVFISKLDEAGNFIWAKKIGNQQSGLGSPQFALDNSSNVYISSTFFDTLDLDPGPGIFNLYTPLIQTIYFCKIDSGGNFNWAKQIGGINNNYNWVSCITLDVSGNIYSTGIFQGTEDFNPNTAIFNLTSYGSWDTYILKLNQITTDIEENKIKTNFILYPNPATTFITIKTGSTKKQVITIMDTTGKIVYTTITLSDKTKINTSNFAQGVYAVQVQTGVGVTTSKLIIQ